jgi:hypothetical protein
MKMQINKPELYISIALLLLIVVSLATIWQDQRRFPDAVPELCLPPDSDILKFDKAVINGKDRWLFNGICPMSTEQVHQFISGRLAKAGWQEEEKIEGKRYLFTKDNLSAMLVTHTDPSGCVYTFIYRQPVLVD